MGKVAQGSITLTSISDAYSVMLSPSSCVITTDYNGKNPSLKYAYTDIRLIRGDKAVESMQPIITNQSNDTKYQITQIDQVTWRISIVSLSEGDLGGSVELNISDGTTISLPVSFTYSVVREASMLDWVVDWNGTYTEISGKWVITPKIFAGNKNSLGQITGVYLGPSLDGSGSAGIYGYKNDESIFRITESEAILGGWLLDSKGIQTVDGRLKILSNGSISASSDNTTAWQLNSNGTASFANGKVTFSGDGSASFEGTIKALQGEIGGWHIGTHSLFSNNIFIDSNSSFLGIAYPGSIATGPEPSKDLVYSTICKRGGVALFSSSQTQYGMECWLPATDTNSTGELAFKLGPVNMIAGWGFDNEAIYLGGKVNTQREYTKESGSITVGTAGLRGRSWYIDTDGEIDFLNGRLHFTDETATIGSWIIQDNAIVTQHAALSSNSSDAGLYLSIADISTASPSQYLTKVLAKGGICLRAKESNVELSGYQTINNIVRQLFSLNSTKASFIGPWFFTPNSLYLGEEKNVAGAFTNAEGDVTIGSQGIRGYLWRLESDGSGALAGGAISWNAIGAVTLSPSVSMSWNQITDGKGGTMIDANGLFTGKISADNITAGTISTASITSEDKWLLDRNGSGYLAQKNISWDENGNLSVKGNVDIETLRYRIEEGCGPWGDKNGDGSVVNDAFRITDISSGDLSYKLPHLELNEFRVIKMVVTQETRSMGSITLSVSNSADTIVESLEYESTGAKSQAINEKGYYELIGYTMENGQTIWRVIKIGG